MKTWNDERLETIISRLLITGVLASALVVTLGGACFLWQHGHERADYHVFRPALRSYRNLGAVIRAAGPSDCRAIIQLGLLLLIATPVARVAFSLFGFALERDRTYVVLTSIVLAVLIYSFIGGVN
jgi:uncharacterized membrane protein